MIGYAGTEVFSEKLRDEWERATRIVARLPEKDSKGRLIRCHELVRAVLPFLELRWILLDGVYAGSVNHTWLISYDQPPCVVLDLYSVARVPMVQLVDHGCREGEVSFHFDLFKGGWARRRDIRRSVVKELEDQIASGFRRGGRKPGDRYPLAARNLAHSSDLREAPGHGKSRSVDRHARPRNRP